MNIKNVQIEKYNEHYYKHFNNSLWLLLVRQNSEDGIQFTDKESAKYSTKDLKRYSILSKLSERYKINSEYYEFILEYIISNTSKINWWRQNDNPMNIGELYNECISSDLLPSDKKLSGFNIIHNDLHLSQWRGLSKSKNSHTLLDGTTFTCDFFFAVGMVEYLSGYIPTNKNQGSKESLLWVRLPELSCIFQKSITKTLRSYHFNICFVFIILFDGS